MFKVKMHRFSIYQVCLPTLFVAILTLKFFLNASTSFFFKRVQSHTKNVVCRLSRPCGAYLV